MKRSHVLFMTAGLLLIVISAAVAGKISDHLTATTPAGDDYVVGVDISDTTQGSAGTTKKFRLRDLPIPDAVQVELTGLAATLGDDAFVYIAWASDNAGTGFTTTFNPDLNYIAVLSTTTEIAAPQASDFSGRWTRYRGLGLEPCATASNNCRVDVPRNDSVPSVTPPAGYGSFGLSVNGVWFCNNGIVNEWTPCWEELSGRVAVPVYSDEPCLPGQWALDTSYRYDCPASGDWRRIALGAWSNPAPAYPNLNSATIALNGITLTLVFSAAVTQGVGYNDSDWNVDCSTTGNDIGVTYASGNTTNTHIYTLTATVEDGEACDIDFNGDADSMENAAGADLPAIAGANVFNGSAAGGAFTLGHNPTTTPSGTGSSPGSFARYVAEQSFTARSIHIYTVGTGGTGILGGIYADAGSTPAAPSTRVQTSATTTTVATGWTCANLAASVSITSGTAYWIGWLANGSIVYGRSGGANARYGNSDTYPNLSSSYNGTSTSAYDLGVYISSEVCQ